MNSFIKMVQENSPVTSHLVSNVAWGSVTCSQVDPYSRVVDA